MRNEEFKAHSKDRHHRGDGHKRKDHDHHHRGAKTFRRGRAIAFLEMMNIKRSTIKQQLDAPEFQSINQILVGELKAMDMVINEFVQLFELHEHEAMESDQKNTNQEDTATEEDLDNSENAEE
ncbi:hypothetical protein [Neobacillus cucumis]|uniref:hypothetical protein n=1 Tax=Neobacillus cucumis TaxID=1740721 RepID=UPI002852FCA9|nr:hypothetical protein [Neobacillus cucumis]MDR4947966.1 hypothetical protein [Neobacillus cucumis]